VPTLVRPAVPPALLPPDPLPPVPVRPPLPDPPEPICPPMTDPPEPNCPPIDEPPEPLCPPVVLPPLAVLPPEAVVLPPLAVFPPEPVELPPCSVLPPEAVVLPPCAVLPPEAVELPPCAVLPPEDAVLPPLVVAPPEAPPVSEGVFPAGSQAVRRKNPIANRCNFMWLLRTYSGILRAFRLTKDPCQVAFSEPGCRCGSARGLPGSSRSQDSSSVAWRRTGSSTAAKSRLSAGWRPRCRRWSGIAEGSLRSLAALLAVATHVVCKGGLTHWP
jgi:hypothetical protein